MTDEEKAAQQARVAHVTRPLVRSDKLAARYVTRGELASVLAGLANVSIGQAVVVRDLIDGDVVTAKSSMRRLEDELIKMTESLRDLIEVSESVPNDR